MCVSVCVLCKYEQLRRSDHGATIARDCELPEVLGIEIIPTKVAAMLLTTDPSLQPTLLLSRLHSII